MHVPCFLSAVVLPRPCASIRRAASGRPAVRFIVAQAYDPMSPPPSSSSSVSMNEDNGSQDKDATTTTSTPNGSYAAVEENALALGKEIATRPVFYSVLAVWTVTGVLALSVSGSVLGSINRLPIIPDVLRLIGLSYSCWFAWRFVVFHEPRERLLSDVRDTIERIKF